MGGTALGGDAAACVDPRRVWQYTACDAACSYAIAEVTTEFSAQAAARFVTRRVLPAYRAAGWPLQRVLTDWGSEYRGPSIRRAPQGRVRI